MIYLDYAATHPMRPEALEAYAKAAAIVGNPASIHAAGQAARERLEDGRAQVALVLGVDPRTLILNSGGTEGNNHVVLAMARQWQEQHKRTGHLITTQTEHSAILAPMRWLQAEGWEVVFLKPDQHGYYSPQQLEQAITPDTTLISIHHANNELGSVQDTTALAAIAQQYGVPYHTDAVQAAGVLPVNIANWGVSFATFSAHKWGGPRGVGFLYIKRGTHLQPLTLGGGQEGGSRAGTQDTAGAYAAGVALTLAEQERPATFAHLLALRTAFEEGLADWPQLRLNHAPHNSPKILSVTLPNTDSEALLMNLDMLGIAASAGSACSAGTMQPSHVLTAIGLSETDARSTLRFSFGKNTTLEEIQTAVSALKQASQWSKV